MYRLRGGSLVVCGDAFAESTKELVDAQFGVGKKNHISAFPLIICDPPYGNIVKVKEWDDLAEYRKWFAHCAEVAAANATICMWGGIGKPGARHFVKFAAEVEERNPSWQIKNWVTWGKRRAYGVSDNYLFTREECLILTRGKPTFNVPLLEELRGYAGYNPDYPAKSEYKRRTNVWSDITELFKGKIHPTQKPDKLYEVLVATHSTKGDAVYDPCAGSGVTARACETLGRRYCVVEKHRPYLDAAGLL